MGTKKEIKVHFKLLLSFFIVKQVVEQGQCMIENNITQIAVIKVQLFKISNSFNAVKLSSSIICPDDIYIIIIIGNTISLAGNPNIKASKIVPSKPNIDANGFKKLAQ